MQSQTYFSQIIKKTSPHEFILHLHFERGKKGLLAGGMDGAKVQGLAALWPS